MACINIKQLLRNSKAKKKQNQDLKLEESTVTYIETVETSAVGEEIITMENLEGQTVILQDQNGTVGFKYTLHIMGNFKLLFSLDHPGTT